MGSSKRKAPRRSPNATQKLRYPVGELLRRHELKENFLSRSKELNSMRKKLNRTNDKIKVLKDVSLQTKKISHTSNPAPAFVISEKMSFSRKQRPTQLQPGNDNMYVPQRSRSRRIQETLLAASEIHGGSKENRQPALDGMFCTLETYGGTKCFEQYVCNSKKLGHASTTVIKKAVTKFEKSHENVCRSLSLLYGAGLLSKRKYAHIRSALGTTSTGTTTAKGYLQRSRMKPIYT